jgi:hypothetical protein
MTYPDCLLCWKLSSDERVEVEAVRKALLQEFRNRDVDAKYWNYIRESPTPPFPTFVAGIAIWLSGKGGTTALYDVFRMWLDARPGRRIEVTVKDIQVDVTKMTREQFGALFGT